MGNQVPESDAICHLWLSAASGLSRYWCRMWSRAALNGCESQHFF